MRVKLLTVTLIALMLSFGLVSCDGGGNPLESGIDDGDRFAVEIPDSNQTEGNISFTAKGHFNVQTWPTLATGQKKCYGAAGEISCPELGDKFFGQDGSYQFGLRDYLDNGDGTVLDFVTGLTWQLGHKEDVTWYGAESYCNSLTLNSDIWRLPDTHELKSLIDYGTAGPAVDSAIVDPAGTNMTFPDTPPNTTSMWFWGAKTALPENIISGQESSWIINFYDGFVEYTFRSNLYNVRCVKAN